MTASRSEDMVQQDVQHNVLQHQDRPALYAKCPACGHLWMVARLPMLLGNAIRRMKHAHCPEGCDVPPVLAGKDDFDA